MAQAATKTKPKTKRGSKKGAAKKSARKSSAPVKRKTKRGKRLASKSRAERASIAAQPATKGAKGRTLLFLNMGRPSVITNELIETICRNLAEGLSFENSCIYSGIADSTGRDWMRRARVAYARMDDERKRIAQEQGVEPFDVEVAPSDIERAYVEFSAAVKRAQAHFQIENLRLIRSGVERWQSNAWMLERRAPDEYALQRGGKGEAAPVQPKGNQPIDRVVGRYTEIYVNSDPVPLPTPEQIKQSASEENDESD